MRKAIAIFKNPEVTGNVKFTQLCEESPVKVDFNLQNLEPNRTRAIHIHEFGDESEGCKSLGGHWNPFNETHGTIIFPDLGRHAGDLINNIVPDDNGKFKYSYNDNLLNMFGPVETTIIGRSVVIHDGIDDLGLGGLDNKGINNLEKFKTSLENGNAGNRLACAIIGIAENS